MMSAPVDATWSTVMALTVAAVPTGMKAGVRMSPRGVFSTPVRARPSAAEISNGKGIKRSLQRSRVLGPLFLNRQSAQQRRQPLCALQILGAAKQAAFLDLFGDRGNIERPAVQGDRLARGENDRRPVR